MATDEQEHTGCVGHALVKMVAAPLPSPEVRDIPVAHIMLSLKPNDTRFQQVIVDQQDGDILAAYTLSHYGMHIFADGSLEAGLTLHLILRSITNDFLLQWHRELRLLIVNECYIAGLQYRVAANYLEKTNPTERCCLKGDYSVLLMEIHAAMVAWAQDGELVTEEIPRTHLLLEVS